MPRLRRMASPSGVVGPLAASTTYLASMDSAVSELITLPMAAGTSTSQGMLSIVPGSISSPAQVQQCKSAGMNLKEDCLHYCPDHRVVSASMDLMPLAVTTCTSTGEFEIKIEATACLSYGRIKFWAQALQAGRQLI